MKCTICSNRNKRNICKICHEGDCFEEIPQTNADRIRNMDNENLAKFIGAVMCATLCHDCGYPACYSMNGDYCHGVKERTDKEILKWLGK